MKLPAYPRTKPSRVEWLGDVPEHWESKRFGYLFRFYSGGTPSTSESELWDGELPWVSSKDMKSMVISDTEDHISEEAVHQSSTCKLPAGSLLMVNRSGILRHLAMHLTQVTTARQNG
jgi:type I restriction enzyme S subunit